MGAQLCGLSAAKALALSGPRFSHLQNGEQNGTAAPPGAVLGAFEQGTLARGALGPGFATLAALAFGAGSVFVLAWSVRAALRDPLASAR